MIKIDHSHTNISFLCLPLHIRYLSLFQYHMKFQNHHRHHFIKYPSLFFIAYIFRSSRLLSFFNPRRKYLNNKDELNWLNSSDVLSCSQPKFCANSQKIMTKIYYTYQNTFFYKSPKYCSR